MTLYRDALFAVPVTDPLAPSNVSSLPRSRPFYVEIRGSVPRAASDGLDSLKDCKFQKFGLTSRDIAVILEKG